MICYPCLEVVKHHAVYTKKTQLDLIYSYSVRFIDTRQFKLANGLTAAVSTSPYMSKDKSGPAPACSYLEFSHPQVGQWFKGPAQVGQWL